MKYEYGTILQFTDKAIKKHPSLCDTNDRMIVVGKDECIWYKNEPTDNNYKKPSVIIPAFTVFTFDLYRVFDSFVEKSNEDLPQLEFDNRHYQDVYIKEEVLEKYIKDFSINMVNEFKQHLIEK